MTERNIAIGIDSTKAVSGGRVVKRALDDVGNAAAGAEDKVKRLSTSANDNLRQIAQSAGGATTGLARLQAMFSALTGSVRETVVAFAALVTVIAGLAIGKLITDFVRLADTYKNMTSQLKLVTSGATQLADVQEKLFQSAQRSRSSYESTTTLYAKLARSASELGLSQDQLLTITENVNKAFIISGAGADEAAGAIRQLAQGLASGALRGDEFNTIAEAAPRLLQAVAEHLKMGVGQLRAYAAEGKITAKVLSEALLAATTKLNNEFGQMGTTVGQAMTVLGNSVLRAVGKLDSALGITDALARGIIAISTAIDNLGATFSALAPYLAIIGTGLAVAFGPTVVATVGALAIAIGGGLVNAIAAASSAMVAFSLSNPFTAILLAVTTAVAAIYYFRDEIQKAIGVDVVGIAKDAANYVIGSFVAAWTDIKTIWEQFPNMMGAAFIGGVNAAIDQLNVLVDSVRGAVNTIIDALNMIGAGLEKLDPNYGRIDNIFNTYLIDLELAIKKRNKLVDDALSTDWIGKMTKIFTPSTPGTAPTVPGTTTSTTSNNDPAELTKITTAAENKIRALKSEADALKLTGYAASVYREQQELINAALEKGITLTPQQTANLKDLGAQMAALKSQNAASSMLQDQQASIGRLQLERELITATTAEREKALAVYDAEQQMIQKGINLQSQQAQAISANAAAMAQLKLENERISAAYATIQQTGASAIDTLVQGATTVGNSWKDTMRTILQSFVSTFAQLAVANPLKNMLFGSNLPTIQDLFAGKSSAAFTPGSTTTGTMTVTAGTVMVNGAIPGIPSTIAGGNTTLGAFLGAPSAVTNGVRPALTPSGIVNSPVTGVISNGVRPDLIAGGIVNSPVAANQNMPTSSVEAYIRQAALARGIDPNVAVAVAKSEGGVDSWNLQSQYMRNGIQEPSYGPFQLLKGGQGTGYPTGLGNDFMSRTGLDPALAANGPAGVDFALDHASRNGWSAWYGADKAGISRWEGIGPRPATALQDTAANSNQVMPALDQANQSLTKLSTSSMKASTDVSSLSTGADSAAKALSTSTSSVSTSASSLATTTAQIPAQTNNLFSSMMSSIGGGFSSLFSGIGSIFSGLFADGGVFKGGNVTAFANGGLVTKPTMFPMRSGIGLMGEKGPEAIMPLKRGPGGALGVSMHGSVSSGGGQTVVHRYEMNSTIKVEGTGDKDLQEKLKAGVDVQLKNGFKEFERDRLPVRMKEINSDKWARG